MIGIAVAFFVGFITGMTTVIGYVAGWWGNRP